MLTHRLTKQTTHCRNSQSGDRTHPIRENCGIAPRSSRARPTPQRERHTHTVLCKPHRCKPKRPPLVVLIAAAWPPDLLCIREKQTSRAKPSPSVHATSGPPAMRAKPRTLRTPFLTPRPRATVPVGPHPQILAKRDPKTRLRRVLFSNLTPKTLYAQSKNQYRHPKNAQYRSFYDGAGPETHPILSFIQ